MNFKSYKKTLPKKERSLEELILLLRWKPMNCPKGTGLWGLYLGTGRNFPVKIYTCPRTGVATNTMFSSGKPNLLKTQEEFYSNKELQSWLLHKTEKEAPQEPRRP